MVICQVQFEGQQSQNQKLQPVVGLYSLTSFRWIFSASSDLLA